MEKINFTFIIPHKNIPKLLERCVLSIPQRKDVEIIVVDDNSSLTENEKEHIINLRQENYSVIFTNENKGAGYARNIGLKHAKGNWILFADADDFYLDCLNDLLNRYVESDYQIIYFNAKSVNSDTLEDANRSLVLNQYFKLNDYDNFKYSFYPPWCKIIKKNLIDTNNITFSETPAANDAIFSVKTGWNAQKIKLDPTQCYCVTFRPGSLEQTKNISVIKSRILISLEVNNFYRENSINRECDLYYRHLLNMFFLDKKEFFKLLKKCNDYGYSYINLIYKMLKRILHKIKK